MGLDKNHELWYAPTSFSFSVMKTETHEKQSHA